MAFDMLADATLPGVELHGANDPALLRRDTNDDHPFLVVTDAVVDDLAALSPHVSSVVQPNARL